MLVQYCTLYCTVLVQYCTLYCTVLYCTVLYCTVLYCTVLFCTMLVQYCTLYCTMLVQYYRLYCTGLYCTGLYCTVLVQYCTFNTLKLLYCLVLPPVAVLPYISLFHLHNIHLNFKLFYCENIVTIEPTRFLTVCVIKVRVKYIFLVDFFTLNTELQCTVLYVIQCSSCMLLYTGVLPQWSGEMSILGIRLRAERNV